MPKLYSVHKNLFDMLEIDAPTFDFITVKHDHKEIPVVIHATLDCERHDELELIIFPIKQVGPDFPKSIVITPMLYDFDVSPLTDEGEIKCLLSHFLRTQIKLSNADKRTNTLLSGFASAVEALH